MKIKLIISLVSIFFIFACKQQVKNKLGVSEIEVNKEELVSQTKDIKNGIIQTNKDCFTLTDINDLDLFFKSIANKDLNYKLEKYIFEKEDLQNFKKLLTSDNFDSFKLKHNNVECDAYIILDIYERQKFEDEGEIHYSEKNIMYELTKKGQNIIVKSAGTAG